ncbi:Peroxidase-like [Homarus americanus]|uniref:Peroxidase-like n=1 Tax=Homarus americanus TaxID=6706 RepID=A0A8J5K2T0_HOMAM|nr:Peroxidase-like [Homarus americanus]
MPRLTLMVYPQAKSLVNRLIQVMECYLDPTASPYWLDPDGLEANLPPELSPDHLAMLPKKCKISVGTCDGSVLYRSASGRCNNLIHPEYGTSGQFLYRLLSPVYGEPLTLLWVDRGMMRTASVLGGLLPNPRLVSLLVHRVPHLPSHPSQPTIFSAPQHNAMVMQMGQFIDHDYSITNAHGKKICNSCTSWQAPWCAPIPLPKYDPFIPSLDDKGERRCLPVVRSVAKFEEDYRGRKILQQHNLNTAFLDLSLIYGNDLCVQKNLRLFSGGLLNSSENERLLLKESHNFPDCRTYDKLCAFSGDPSPCRMHVKYHVSFYSFPRPNENPGLALLHMVFHREHNRLAKSLQAINTHWDDEKLFQEARRINIAQHQHCTSLEYVPIIVGYDMAARHKLLPQQNGYFMGYNESRNPSILNEFSTAAFRMGHSSIPDTLQLLDPHYKLLSSVPMVSTFHNPGPADPLLRGLLGSVMLPTDLRLADRRDHGLAPYVKYVFYCGVGEVKDFSDLRSLMSIRAVAALRQAYRHVHDIDLYVGGLAENHLPGATVGPTFACIITLQFKITKTSDRFW